MLPLKADKILLILSQIMLVILLVYVFWPESKEEMPITPPPDPRELPVASSKMANLTLEGSGGKFSLESYFRRDPVVVEFLSTSCPYCQKMAPVFARVMPGSGVKFISVAISGENLSEFERWASQNGQEGDLAIDPKGQAVKKLDLLGTPSTYFVARGGRIKQSITGEFPPEQLRAFLAELR